MQRIFSWVVFVSGFYLFAAWASNMSWSNFYLNPYDGAIRLLQHSWTQKGLIPYKDFYSYYPPGLFLLIGKILPYTTIAARNIWLGVITGGLVLVNGMILLRTFDLKGRLLLTFGIYLGLAALTFIYLAAADPLILLLMQTIIFASWWYYLRRSKVALIFVFLSSTCAVWFRWDWPFLVILSQSGLLGLSLIWHWTGRSAIYIWVVTIAGVVLGLVSFLVYLQALGAENYVYELLFLLPLTANIKYSRILPGLPMSLNDDSFLPFGVFGFLFCSLGFIWLSARQKIPQAPVWLWLPGLVSLLPYALSRLDWYHAVPLGFVWGSVVLLLFLTHHYPARYLAVFGLLLVTFTVNLLKDRPGLPARKNTLIQSMRYWLTPCQDLVGDTREYRSMFVGRSDYNLMNYNILALHFLDTNLPPATPFIYEAPGVQNICRFGEAIAADLTKASKPMLTFLYRADLNPPISEVLIPVKSCGRIEKYLTETIFTPVGFCQAWNWTFEVRKYE